MSERMSNDTDFMSRKETNKLILLGVVLLLLVIYVLEDTFQPSVEDSGVPVKVEGHRGPGVSPEYESPIPVVRRPSQDPAAALETWRAYEENRTQGNVATVSSQDWAYAPQKLASAGDLQLDLVKIP